MKSFIVKVFSLFCSVVALFGIMLLSVLTVSVNAQEVPVSDTAIESATPVEGEEDVPVVLDLSRFGPVKVKVFEKLTTVGMETELGVWFSTHEDIRVVSVQQHLLPGTLARLTQFTTVIFYQEPVQVAIMPETVVYPPKDDELTTDASPYEVITISFTSKVGMEDAKREVEARYDAWRAKYPHLKVIDGMEDGRHIDDARHLDDAALRDTGGFSWANVTRVVIFRDPTKVKK